jgi:indoleamine 2,3-dioxygenase
MAIDIHSLDEFGISRKRGFLSDNAPLSKFTNNYYHKWDELLENLHYLISTFALSKEIDSLPILSTAKLSSDLEVQHAYVTLAFLVHGYVWGGSRDGQPIENIPPQLSEPFLAVCEYLNMEPVLSYAGLCIWNWTPNNVLIESSFYELDDIRSVGSFTGTRGEDAFYHVPVLIEAEAGPLVSSFLGALAAAQTNNFTQVIDVLIQAANTFVRMSVHLSKLYSTLDAHSFFHEVRPFISGSKGMEEKGLPCGMIFHMSNGSERAVKCVGGNAGQSSTFQFLDYVLGVKHQGAEDGKESFYEVRIRRLENRSFSLRFIRKHAYICLGSTENFFSLSPNCLPYALLLNKIGAMQNLFRLLRTV